MGNIQEEYAKSAPPGADFAYHGYQDRKEIIADITTVKANDPASDINIVGHSRGAALGVNIAANELAKANIQINILIAIDSVGTRFTTPGLWMPSGSLSNVTTFINLNTNALNRDGTDRIAWAGGHYGEDSRRSTPLYFNLNYNHGQAAAMLKAPIALPKSSAQSAWDYLLQSTKNNGK
jgi:pimeloyl-ACP methyl ester carboxylesterase